MNLRLPSFLRKRFFSSIIFFSCAPRDLAAVVAVLFHDKRPLYFRVDLPRIDVSSISRSRGNCNRRDPRVKGKL